MWPPCAPFHSVISRSAQQLGSPSQRHGLTRIVLRAAYAIGVNQQLTISVADVDTTRGAVHRLHYHGAVACPVEMIDGCITPDGIRTIENALIQIAGRLSLLPRRPTEHAGILSPELGRAINSAQVVASLTRDHMIHIVIPPNTEAMEKFALVSYTAASMLPRLATDRLIVWSEVGATGNIALLRRHLEPDNASCDHQPQSVAAALHSHVVGTDWKVNTVEQVSQNSDPQYFRTMMWDSGYSASSVTQLLLSKYQRRNPAIPTHRCSPNPVNVSEARALLDDLSNNIRERLPRSLKKGIRGNERYFVGSSLNSGTLNVASRVAGTVRVPQSVLMQATFGRVVGMTDAYLARSFQEPTLIVSQLILTLAFLRALDAKSITYLPEVALSHGLLLEPSLYAQGDELRIQNEIDSDPQMYSPIYFSKPWRATSPHDPHLDPRIGSARYVSNWRSSNET